MAINTEQAAFIASICSNPEDDTVRLAYADWLDENPKACPLCGGVGTYSTYAPPDSTVDRRRCCYACEPSELVNPARAKFIRVQIELTRFDDLHPEDMRHCGSYMCSDSMRMGACLCDCEGCRELSNSDDERNDRYEKREQLRDEEIRLWKTVKDQFGPEVSSTATRGWTSRGFMNQAEVTYEGWLRYASWLYWHPDQKRKCPITAQPLKWVLLCTSPHAFSDVEGVMWVDEGLWDWNRFLTDAKEQWPGVKFGRTRRELGRG